MGDVSLQTWPCGKQGPSVKVKTTSVMGIGDRNNRIEFLMEIPPRIRGQSKETEGIGVQSLGEGSGTRTPESSAHSPSTF